MMRAEEKCRLIEGILVETGETNPKIKELLCEHDGRDHTRRLIAERKDARRNGTREEVTRISKQLRRESKAIDRSRKGDTFAKCLKISGTKRVLGASTRTVGRSS